ncbi:hypothetical protein [Eleftheria terrae]|uniref:hypothetical protein n=1 Tax=Eleftheria terrae TaxID=1597781 RepID=UPI00263A5FE8|nr:hypothetical protein [Eleftheria terrae]WKB50508.1 hypothetical protein N7L95_00230 [Eleftheria terrae]
MHHRTAIVMLALLAAGCDKAPESSNKPVESLSYEEKQAIVEQCDKSGKLATDSYCKEVVHVYSKERHDRKEQERVSKVRNRTPVTTVNESP